MQIIANTENGYLIQATKIEIDAILNAVNGTVPKEIKLGQKIPAIDYASTIQKIKKLSKSYDYTQLIVKVKDFVEEARKLDDVVQGAASIEFD